MQISIIGYKGQGVKTLSRILSRAGLLAGMISEDFSESGNIVKAYVRIDKQQMLEKGPIKNADFMIVLDHSLFSSKEVKENITYIINALEKPKALAKEKNIHALEASEIAFKNTGKGIPNTPIAGALTKYYTKIQLKHIKQAIEIELSKKQKENCLAAEEGLKVVR